MSKQPNAIVDANKQVMRCIKCGDEVPIPLGVIPWVCAVTAAFDEAHKNCNGQSDKTYMSEPNWDDEDLKKRMQRWSK